MSTSRSVRRLAALATLIVAGCSTFSKPVELSAAELLREADGLFRDNEHEEARRTYEAAAHAAERSGDDSIQTQAASEVASLHALDGTFEAGLPWLERAAATADPDSPRAWTRYLMARALYEREAGETQNAHATYRDAYDTALAAELYGRAVQASYMAQFLPGDAERVAWARLGIAAAQEQGDPRWLAALWTGFGWLLEDLGRHEESLEAFRAARELVRQQNDPRAMLRADWTVAHALRMSGHLVEARDLAERSLATAQRRYDANRSANDAEWLAHCQRELAELAAAEERWTVALSLLLVARERFLESGIEELAPESLERLDQRIVEVRARAREAAAQR